MYILFACEGMTHEVQVILTWHPHLLVLKCTVDGTRTLKGIQVAPATYPQQRVTAQESNLQPPPPYMDHLLKKLRKTLDLTSYKIHITTVIHPFLAQRPLLLYLSISQPLCGDAYTPCFSQNISQSSLLSMQFWGVSGYSSTPEMLECAFY